MLAPVAPELVIFDCDGVLVDSEAIALGAMRDALAGLGLPLDTAEVHRRFLGRSLATIAADLRAVGIEFDAACRAALSAELRRRFQRELRAVAGMASLVERLAVPACVASSSHRERLLHSLATAGLLDRFGEAVFSADEVARGKPHPDLFLHAARRMGAEPSACLVVEDSLPGLRAAAAAGMRAVAFAAGSHLDAAATAELRARADLFAADAAALAALLPLRDEREGPAAIGGRPPAPGS